MRRGMLPAVAFVVEMGILARLVAVSVDEPWLGEGQPHPGKIMVESLPALLDESPDTVPLPRELRTEFGQEMTPFCRGGDSPRNHFPSAVGGSFGIGEIPEVSYENAR